MTSAVAITLRTTLGVDLDLGKGAREAFLALSSAYPATPSQVLAIPFMHTAASPERLAAMVADAQAMQKGGQPLTALAEAVLGDVVTFGAAALSAAGHPLQASAPLRKGGAGELRTVLAAHMHRAYTVYLDELTIAGRLSREERMAAGNIVGKALEVLEQEFDTDLGRRAVTAHTGEGVEKAEWMEAEHPRDATGEFTGGPGGGSAAKPEPSQPTGGLGTTDRQRLKELGVKKYPPPTASDVTVHQDADPKTQALVSWRDAKGRTQSSYASQFHERTAALKWKRVEKYRAKRDAVRQKAIEKLRGSKPGEKDFERGLVVGIIGHTGLRPGNPGSAATGHYGITTLRPEHVTITEHATAELRFVGKSGKENHVVIEQPELVQGLKSAKEHATSTGQESLFTLRPEEARDAMPAGMKLKDMRTIIATETAERELAAEFPPLPPDPKQAKRAIVKRMKEVSAKVASVIQNTPAVARSSYIHPTVFDDWLRRIGGEKLAG